MKWIIIALVGLGLLLVALVLINPVLALAVKGPMPRVEAKLSLRGEAIACDLQLKDSKNDRYITEIHVARSIAEKMKIGVPENFRIEELADSRDDPEWLKTWNRENLRFTGRMTISPDVTYTILFPAATSTLDGVEIGGQYESGKKFGNMTGFFRAKL